jgi:pimeloyl-ACP methyl ester carboxylesterase
VLDSLRIRLLGVPLEIKAYANVLKSLGVFAGYRDESLGRSGAVDYGSDHYTCFQFPYDWRLDVPANARRLHEFIEEKAAYVEEQDRIRFGRKRDSVKFDVVAHSYGALVLRYYLRYGNRTPDDATEAVVSPTWEGARRVERAILVAPPNGGSLKSLDSLLYGRRFGLFSYNYSPAILGTFPSLYATLPRTRHAALVDADENAVDLFDPEVWIAHSWGLADTNQDAELRKLLPGVANASERRDIALRGLRHNLAIAKRTQAELDLPSTPPPGLTIHLIAGDAEQTPSRAAIPRAGGGLRVVAREPGDGTVTRTSALMDERQGGEWSRRIRSPIEWESVLFVAANHLGMTEDSMFTDNLLFTLLQAH